MRRFACAVLAILLLDASAWAERPKQHFAEACGLTGTPTSVVVDVYDLAAPGSLLATILNAEVARVATTDCYGVDLATTTATISYPAPSLPTEKHYLLAFRDDAGNEAFAVEQVLGVVDDFDACRRETAGYVTTPDLSRGITSQLIQQGVPSHWKIELDCTRQFTAPPVTYYWIFQYDPSGKVSLRDISPTPP